MAFVAGETRCRDNMVLANAERGWEIINGAALYDDQRRGVTVGNYAREFIVPFYFFSLHRLDRAMAPAILPLIGWRGSSSWRGLKRELLPA